jgi:hypothetical protein
MAGGGRPNPDGAWAWCAFQNADSVRPMQEAVARTGGDVYRDWQRHPDAAAAFEKVFRDFRQSYILHYSPDGVPRAGWHQLVVDVPGGKYTVRARPGYFGD